MKKSNKQINEYLEEVFDKVWYVRSVSLTPDDKAEKLKQEHPEIYKGMMENRERVLNTYGTKWLEELDEYEYGFLSGTMATLRWVLGADSKTWLDT